jgi:hypothetical protein
MEEKNCKITIREKRNPTLKTSISKLLIKTLQNALKDVDKLERLYLKANKRQKREACK